MMQILLNHDLGARALKENGANWEVAESLVSDSNAFVRQTLQDVCNLVFHVSRIGIFTAHLLQYSMISKWQLVPVQERCGNYACMRQHWRMKQPRLIVTTVRVSAHRVAVLSAARAEASAAGLVLVCVALGLHCASTGISF